MLTFYAIAPAFYQTMKTHRTFFEYALALPKEQRQYLLIEISKEDVTKSAISYFGTTIYEQGNELLLDLQPTQSKCLVKDGAVELDHKKNPFYELLSRKYPFHICQDF